MYASPARSSFGEECHGDCRQMAALVPGFLGYLLLTAYHFMLMPVYAVHVRAHGEQAPTR